MNTLVEVSEPVEIENVAEEDLFSPKEKFWRALVAAFERFGTEHSLSMWGIAEKLRIRREHLYAFYDSSDSLDRVSRDKLVMIIKRLRLSYRNRKDLFDKLQLFWPSATGTAFKHKKKWRRRHVRGWTSATRYAVHL